MIFPSWAVVSVNLVPLYIQQCFQGDTEFCLDTVRRALYAGRCPSKIHNVSVTCPSAVKHSTLIDKGGLVYAVLVGRFWQQVLEAAGHIASSFRKKEW